MLNEVRVFKASAKMSCFQLKQFLYFYTLVSFKISGTKTTIDSDKISLEIFENLQISCSEITFKLYVNPE